jgi:hypothetical protein
MVLAAGDGRVTLEVWAGGRKPEARHVHEGDEMRADPDGALLGASLAFAGAAVLGSVVAVRDQLPGKPLGVGIWPSAST